MRLRAPLPAAVAALVAFACAGAESTEGSGPRSQEIIVFAAASLTDALGAIAGEFENRRHGVQVELNFLSSSDLAAQIEQGAPANVYASADETNMSRVVDGGYVVGEPAVFAHNKLAIVVPAGNPAAIRGLSDLEKDDLVIALCNEECPAGKYAVEIFENAGVDVEPDSLESDVKAVITRIEAGEADAGIVYVTDVAAAGDAVTGVSLPDTQNVVATYPIAGLKDSPRAAEQFVDFVLSRRGQEILQSFGFLPK